MVGIESRLLTESTYSQESLPIKKPPLPIDLGEALNYLQPTTEIQALLHDQNKVLFAQISGLEPDESSGELERVLAVLYGKAFNLASSGDVSQLVFKYSFKTTPEVADMVMSLAGRTDTDGAVCYLQTPFLLQEKVFTDMQEKTAPTSTNIELYSANLSERGFTKIEDGADFRNTGNVYKSAE